MRCCSRSITGWPRGIVLGVGLSAALSAALHNASVGTAIGAALGVVFALTSQPACSERVGGVPADGEGSPRCE